MMLGLLLQQIQQLPGVLLTEADFLAAVDDQTGDAHHLVLIPQGGEVVQVVDLGGDARVLGGDALSGGHQLGAHGAGQGDQYLDVNGLGNPAKIGLNIGIHALAGAGGVMKNHPALVTVSAVFALVMTLAMAIWGSREKQLSKGALWGLGLVAGGGASNLCERLRHGGVLDYIRFPRLPGKLDKLVFNPADFGIFAGVLAVLWKELTE